MKILISGSSGLIGSALIPLLTNEGHEVVKLVRHQTNLLPNEIAWDPQRGVTDPSFLEGLDAVIHLAGDNIGSGRWTKEKKQQIYDSRVVGTKLLSQALISLKKPPKVLISASAVGYYGDRGSEILTEKSSKGNGFLADVCHDWEKASECVIDHGIRLVNLRIGVVLSSKGGALKQMLTPFKLGVGGAIGSGQQYVSWIAIDDLLGMIHHILVQESLRGPINGVSPYPVTNQELTDTLGKVLGRPTWVRMPAFIAKLVFGEMAESLLLSSTRVEPTVALESGFQFTYARLEGALDHLVGKVDTPVS